MPAFDTDLSVAFLKMSRRRILKHVIFQEHGNGLKVILTSVDNIEANRYVLPLHCFGHVTHRQRVVTLKNK